MEEEELLYAAGNQIKKQLGHYLAELTHVFPTTQQ